MANCCNNPACRIIESGKFKVIESDAFHCVFNKESGFTATWGKTEDEDPDFSPAGPIICDMEISTICELQCAHCYKSLTPNGKNMTLSEFQTLFAKLPRSITQIAFGLGSTLANPSVFDMFQYARSHGCIPNCTVNGVGMNKDTARRLANVCGAVAVSKYNPKSICYNAVQMLTDAGLKQVNIHAMVADNTFSDCMELLDDAQRDPRLGKLNAIVFLSGKKKGRGTWLTPVSQDKYKELIDTALSKEIRIGFDSCSAHRFLDAVKGHPQEGLFNILAEPCESGLFSSYISVDGIYYPCSFSDEAVEGINLFKIDDFMKDVWHSTKVEAWRKRLLDNHRNCPLFEI